MQKLLISDLHLSADHPRLIRGFLALLDAYQQQGVELYILGDWFDAWLADNDPSAWLLPVVAGLRDFTAAGNTVFFLHGNRDFILGQRFLDRFAGQLILEPFTLVWQGLRVRLEHGDALCSDDLSYQRFKKIIRNPWLLALLKCLPFYFKRHLANLFRKKSRQKQKNSYYQPVDVNLDSVQQHMHGVDLLIHGHTHRPAIHLLPQDKRRIVLGDWREDLGEAKILSLPTAGDLHLFDWYF
jgi:UDP-2,3-diacylglucosamine hydrolase